MKTSDNNAQRILNFSNKYLKATWLKNVDSYFLEGRTIVVNLGVQKAIIKSATPEKYLSPRTSTILQEVAITNAEKLVLIKIEEATNIGGILLEKGWHQLGEIAKFPKDIPLWKSPQDEVGTVEFDPYFVTGQSEKPEDKNLRKYLVKVNLWLAPANTNCGLHNKHANPEFLEIHTQIYGTGRMQKFHQPDINSLYEDVIMSPGETHIPFASVGESGQFIYPWHQYYSDNDCIWMANEFHPVSR